MGQGAAKSAPSVVVSLTKRFVRLQPIS
jgi:hypothetical protein